MRNKFLARAYEASGSLAGAIGITWGSFFMLGGLPLLAAVAYVFVIDPEAGKAYLGDPFDYTLLGLPRLVFFILMMLNFVIAMAGLWVGVKFISKQRFFTLLSGHDKLRWTRGLGAMLLWMLLMGIYSATQYALTPNAFEVSTDRDELIWWILPGLLLIPIQSGFEEISLRGQLLQAFGKSRPRNPMIGLLVTSFIFALLHGLNAEVGVYGFVPMMLQYLIFGLFLGAFTLMDEGLEIAIGIHIGNNLFSLFFLGYTGSSLDTPCLFRQTTASPTNDLFGVMLMFFIVFLIYFGRKPQLLRQLLPTPSEED